MATIGRRIWAVLRSGVFKWLASAVALVLGAAAALTWTTVGTPLVYRISHPLPHVDRSQYVVLVSDLAGDDGARTQSRRVSEQLARQFADLGAESPIRIVRWPRTLLQSSDADQIRAGAAAEREGQRWLAQSGARILVWGVVRKDNAELVVRLVRPNQVRVDAGLQRPFQDDAFQAALVGEVAPALAATIAADAAPAYQTGTFNGEVLAPLVERLRPLLHSDSLPTNAKLTVTAAFADAATTLGIQTGSNDLLNEAIAAYRAELDVLSEPDLPPGLDIRAKTTTTHVNLGRALTMLGRRETGAAHLNEAVSEFEQALSAVAPGARSRAWALVETNLGIALTLIGERENDSARFSAAAAALRDAQSGIDRKADPRRWAVTASALGAALQQVGWRTGDRASLEESLLWLRPAVSGLSVADAPLQWAAAQHNLGNSYFSLGVTALDDAKLRAAADAYRAALSALDPDATPLYWAGSLAGLAGALEQIGEREIGVAHLTAARRTYEEALQSTPGWQSQDGPGWANACDGLGSTLSKLGERGGDLALLAQAVAVFQRALTVRTRADNPIDYATTQGNLARALAALARIRRAPTDVDGALAASREALGILSPEENGPDWAAAQEVRGLALESAALAGQDRWASALLAFQKAGDAYRAQHNAFGAHQIDAYIARLKGEVATPQPG